MIGPFQTDRKGFLNEVVKPLQEKEETIYVVPGSDAEEFVKRRFPHKQRKQVRGSLLPRSIAGFLNGMRYTFQRGQSAGLNAVYHFTFTGKEPRTATVTIRDKKIEIIDGHAGKPDLRVSADSETWLGFLAKERSLVWPYCAAKSASKDRRDSWLRSANAFRPERSVRRGSFASEVLSL